jgi:HSP20 family protein
LVEDNPPRGSPELFDRWPRLRVPAVKKTEKLHRVESVWGSFARSFTLPDNANADAVKCETKDGQLTVTIPKAAKAAAEPRQIKIE